MDKTIKTNLIAFAAVAAVPAAVATYFNVRTRIDLKRIRQSNEELVTLMTETINSIVN